MTDFKESQLLQVAGIFVLGLYTIQLPLMYLYPVNEQNVNTTNY